MVLREAEENHGFDSSKYPNDNLLKIASQFSTFDANSDGKLEFSEARYGVRVGE